MFKSRIMSQSHECQVGGEMRTSVGLNLITCFYISLHFRFSSSSLIGVHPLDEKYYNSELIECKDGSKSFARNRLNDDFCDCADGSDEPGTSACPAGRFYCRNMGSTPRYLFSSRVNDRICDCCDGSDEYDGTVICPNTCIRGGSIVYQRTSYDTVASNLDNVNSRNTKPGIKMVDAAHKLSGLKTLVLLHMALVIVVLAFILFRRRKSRRRNSR